MSRPDVRKIAIIAAVVAALAAAGFGIYWYLSHRGNQPAKNPADTSGYTQQADARPAITVGTKHYESPAFSLEFDYPEDWTITEAEDGGQIIAASPTMRLDGIDGAVTGKVIFTIRDKKQPLPEFDKGNAAAVRESEKITYLKPSSAQRGSTYMSFLRYAGNYGGSKLDGIFITGDVGYVVSQAIPMADFVPVDPIVSLSFLQCANTACAGQSSPVNVTIALWDETAFSVPLQAMLQSLTIN